MTLAIVGILIVLLCVLLLLNCLPLFFREADDYSHVVTQKPFSPKAEPVVIEQGAKTLLLCIHGFPSTPYIWEYVASEARSRGYDLYAPLLPGCGRSTELFIKTNFSQYSRFVLDTYLTLSKRYDHIHILGISMGGALALGLCETCSSKGYRQPDSLTTIAAPVFINSLRPLVLHRPSLLCIRTLSWFTKSIAPATSEQEDRSTGTDNDSHWAGYHGIYPKQIYSLLMGLRKIRKGLPLIECPVYMIHDRGDRTVPYACRDQIARSIGSKLLRSLSTDLEGQIHSRHTLIIYDSCRDQVISSIFSWLEMGI